MTTDQSSAPSSALRVLVVDDELCIRHVLSSFLRLEGHEVETAADGLAALERFDTGKWDVVLTDRAMPRMNGEELAAEIRERAPAVPIILVTGLGSTVQSPLGSDCSIDAIVRKPFSTAALREAISYAIERRSSFRSSSVDDQGVRAA
jgi:DNA-binding response OmpR family regulator